MANKTIIWLHCCDKYIEKYILTPQIASRDSRTEFKKWESPLLGKRVTRLQDSIGSTMSNGHPFDMMSIGKFIQWCPLDPFLMFNGHVQWVYLIGSNGQCAQSPNLVWRVNISFCPMDPLLPLNTIGHLHCIYWTSCPLNIGSIVSIGHRFHWPLCPLDNF